MTEIKARLSFTVIRIAFGKKVPAGITPLLDSEGKVIIIK